MFGLVLASSLSRRAAQYLVARLRLTVRLRRAAVVLARGDERHTNMGDRGRGWGTFGLRKRAERRSMYENSG
jgi:hypothetical protein